jgi:hypothetical protein
LREVNLVNRPIRDFRGDEMEIKPEHKPLLIALGLKETDFARFDGKQVRYEYDEEMGVRIYDPFYRTSYNEYIGIDGWSAWSREQDTFMTDILKGAREKALAQGKPGAGTRQDEITEALKGKFKGEVKPGGQ